LTTVIAAQTAVIAGAYEGLFGKHKTIPEVNFFENKPVELPNYSIEMSNLAASVIRPQIKSLDERITKYNKRDTLNWSKNWKPALAIICTFPN
jgi:hypothetical protein